MHSLAREQLQRYLYAYKNSNENGITLLTDTTVTHNALKQHRNISATRIIRHAAKQKVCFAVRAEVEYDGSLDNESPLRGLALSFKPAHFFHIYVKYNADWWVGRRVDQGTTLGFVPTGTRLAKITPDLVGDPWVVVPTIRPVIILGPCSPSAQLTRLLRIGLTEQLLTLFEGRMKTFTSTLGQTNDTVEVRAITHLAEKYILLLQSTISTPTDIQRHPISPFIVLIKIANKKILLRLLKHTGGDSKDLSHAAALNALPNSAFDLVLEERGLREAVHKLSKFLEEYWRATHPDNILPPSFAEE